ncbi:MAG TPA: hypothetical protein IAB53_05055 [Candidatus Scybalocola faecipullorum]|nr:hypothetical protein [Candidatus Scybalocola faecipullorum]
MKITPDGAQKMIHSLENQRRQLVEKMNELSTFIVAVSEGNPEDLRPEFNFTDTVNEIKMIDEKIMKIKHARNVFNTTTYLPDEQMTIDEALIMMAVLNNNYKYYTKLGNAQKKRRNMSSYANEIEYIYTNYDIGEAKNCGKSMYDKMLEIQSKLNLVNTTYTFEIDE